MTPEQLALVEASLAAVSERLDKVATDFYDRLFVADPDLVLMFDTDPVVQRTKFSTELRQIIFSIRNHEAFLRRAGALGVRHKEYGVRTAHYRLVGAALLGALAAELGEAWTDEVENAWRLAYNLTAEAMMASAAESPLNSRPRG
jgi:hemoglobin-like flavoprotein